MSNFPVCSLGTQRGALAPSTAELTHAVPPVVLLHHVFAVEHLVADFARVELLAVLLLVLGEVTVGGEEARADVALERLVVWSGRERGRQERNGRHLSKRRQARR